MIAASTFEANSSSGTLARGGAVFNDGTLGLTNCTFAGNSALYGSAVNNEFGVMMRMVNSTIARNIQILPETFALNAGNAFNNVLENNLVIENDRWDVSITNFVPANLTGAFTTSGTNFIGHTNVMLGVLTTNGGPVKTMALPISSPAVNAGFAVVGLDTDARGQLRYEAPDIGAYELPTFAPIFTSPTSTVFVTGQSNNFQFTATSGLPVSFAPLSSFPPGTTLALDGLLSGDPTVPSGLYQNLVRAYNDYNLTDSLFTMTVTDGTTDDRFSWQLNGGAELTNQVFTLTDGGIGQSRSAWYLFKQDINAFQASFDYLDVGGGGADGVAFVLQNAPAGIAALGGGGGGLGYTGISPSFALMVNIYAPAPGGPGIQVSTGGVGLGTNTYINTTPANPASGDPIRFNLTYLGGQLSVTMTNLTTSASFTTNFVLDIPGAVLGNQAWVGMTAATGGATATQRVSNFSFQSLSATATVVVTSAADPAGFDTNLIFSTLGTNVTLRDAVTAANNYPGPSVIRFAPYLAGTNIALQQTGDTSSGSTALPIRGDVTIENTTTGALTISRGVAGDLRLIRVATNGTLTVRNLRIENGRITSSLNGANIENHGSLVLENGVVAGGVSSRGGGLHNVGTALVYRTIFETNTGASGGGGIFNTGKLAVVSSAIVSNLTQVNSGGAAGGGGILNRGTLSLTNSTLAYNYAGNYYGGAIWNFSGSLELTHCTVFENGAFFGTPGIGGFQADVLARNTIIADGSTINQIPGSASNLFFNPNLGAWGFNGGPTPTFPITAASAAHKAGASIPGLGVDQRGVVRHAVPDIGAFEVFPRDPLIVSTTVDENDGNADNEQGTGTSLREALTYAQTLGGTQTITFAASLAGQTVVLDSGWTNASDPSALNVTSAIVIKGRTNAPGITIAVAHSAQKRHFVILGGGQLTLEDLTLTGGRGDYGGSVWNYSGSLHVRRCTFTGNQASIEGGAIHCWGGSLRLEVENSTIVSNTSVGWGSAITTGAGSNSFKHITVTANTGPNAMYLYESVASLHNSIVAGNQSDGIATWGAGAATASSSGNVLGTGSTAGISNGVNGNVTGIAAPALFLNGLSVTNGGPTPTVAILPLSPAFNRGSPLAGITTDQRGSSRINLGAPDAGAFEVIAVESPLVTTTNDEFDATSDPGFGTGTSLREALYYTEDFVNFSTNLAGQTVELTQVGDTAFGNTAILLTNQSPRFIRSTQTPRVTIRVNGPEPMRHLRIAPGAYIVLQGITLTGGQATNGGAVYNQGTLSVSFATLANNTASQAGGAIYNTSNSTVSVIVSTLSDNTAGGWGGAIANGGTITFTYSTVAGNAAPSGGGIFNEPGSVPATINATIIAGNTDGNGAPSDIGGPQLVNASSSYSLIGAGGSGGLVDGVNTNKVGVADPGLAPLADYGGRTPTRALYSWSQAIDASLLITGTDQRGVSRGALRDIGAYEIIASTNPPLLNAFVTTGQTPEEVSIFFTNQTMASFSLYTTTNLLVPASWNFAGIITENPPGSGLFLYAMPIGTNMPNQLYLHVQSP